MQNLNKMTPNDTKFEIVHGGEGKMSQGRSLSIEGDTQITDQVIYVMPFGFIGEIVHTLWVGHRLKGIFDFRKQKVQELFG